MGFRTYYKTIVIKMVCYWCKARSMVLICESRNKPLHLLSIDFSIKVPKQFNREKVVFSPNSARTIGYPHSKKKKKKSKKSIQTLTSHYTQSY